jgi:hypothetical protein
MGAGIVHEPIEALEDGLDVFKDGGLDPVIGPYKLLDLAFNYLELHDLILRVLDVVFSITELLVQEAGVVRDLANGGMQGRYLGLESC